MTSTGGIGKTRLALELAAHLTPTFRDGVTVVELAALTDPLLVPQTVATAFGLRDGASRDVWQVIADTLRLAADAVQADQNRWHAPCNPRPPIMSVYRGLRVSRRQVIRLGLDGTYSLVPGTERPGPPTPAVADPDAARVGVALAALREVYERRLRDSVARRLLCEAGVIDAEPKTHRP